MNDPSRVSILFQKKNNSTYKCYALMFLHGHEKFVNFINKRFGFSIFFLKTLFSIR